MAQNGAGPIPANSTTLRPTSGPEAGFSGAESGLDGTEVGLDGAEVPLDEPESGLEFSTVMV